MSEITVANQRQIHLGADSISIGVIIISKWSVSLSILYLLLFKKLFVLFCLQCNQFKQDNLC